MLVVMETFSQLCVATHSYIVEHSIASEMPSHDDQFLMKCFNAKNNSLYQECIQDKLIEQYFVITIYNYTLQAKVGIKSCRFYQHFYCSSYDASQLAIRQISHCWQVHDFCLFSLLFIVVINPYSFYKFIIFKL